MSPRELLQAHRYASAVRAFGAKLKKRPGASEYVVPHAQALLCLGKYDEALHGFRQAHEKERRGKGEPPGSEEPYLDEIGTCLWLLGRRNEAITAFRAGVEGILDGSIDYAPFSPGVSPALLLWYAGVAAKDRKVRDMALTYLDQLTRKRFTFGLKCWPGPLAFFALGKKTAEDVLAGIVQDFYSMTFNPPLDAATTELRLRTDFAEAFFYVAVQKRDRGDERGWVAALRMCLNVRNPIDLPEWYLARAEMPEWLQKPTLPPSLVSPRPPRTPRP